MANRKYIDRWEGVACNPYCPEAPLVEEALSENAGSPGPNAAISDSIRRQAEYHMNEHGCTFVKDGKCQLARFMTKKALEVKV